MGDKQRADCVAAKAGTTCGEGGPGEQRGDRARKEREEGGSPTQLTFTLSAARAESTGGRTAGTRKGEDTFSRRRHSEEVKMSLVVGLKNMMDEANNGDDYWCARRSSC